MSGGSMDYLYAKVEEGAGMIGQSSPGRAALRDHMLHLARVLQEVEWVDSCDRSPGEDERMITELLGARPVAEAAEKALRSAITDAQIALGKLENA